MGPRKGSYLDANRNPFELLEAVNADMSLLTGSIAVNGGIHMLDLQLVNLQQADIVLTAALEDWVNDARVPFAERRRTKKIISSIENGLQEVTDENYGYMKGVPYESILCATAQTGEEIVESVIQPDWKISNFERWLRFGGRIAMLNVQYSMITNNRGEMPTRPDSKIVYDALLRTACVSELLDKSIEHALTYHDLPKNLHRKLLSDRAMLLENEAILDAYEQDTVHEGISRWFLPASPSLDFGAKTPVHADVITLNFHHKTGDIYIAPVDVKRKSENRRKQADTIRIDAGDIQCLAVRNRKLVVDHSARSRDLIEGHIESNPGTAYEDPNYRASVAYAAMIAQPVKFDLL